MLYTDADFIDPTYLQSIDHDLAKAIIAYDKNSPLDLSVVCKQALSDCARTLISRTQSSRNWRGNWIDANGISSNHYRGLWSYLSSGNNVPRINLGQVVIDSTAAGYTSSIKQWVAFYALVLAYQQIALRVDEGDKYVRRREYYQAQIDDRFWPQLRAIGLPFVYLPLPAPGALHIDGNPWSASSLSTAVQAATVGGTYYVAITWVSQGQSNSYVSPLQKNNAESGPSLIQSITIAPGRSLVVSILGLTPPTGVPRPSNSTTLYNATLTATGWNIYAGPTATSLFLQTALPVPITTTSVQLPSDPAISGYPLQSGQLPNSNLPMPDMLMRG